MYMIYVPSRKCKQVSQIVVYSFLYTVNTPSATEEPEDDDDVPIGIVVGSVVAVTVVCSLLLLALIIFILVTMRSLKTKDAHLEVSAEE